MSRDQAAGYQPPEVFDAASAKRERAEGKWRRVDRTKQERQVEKQQRAARRSTRT